MSDQRYINMHLNTPGYRTYRPAWSMIAWHVTAPNAMQNSRQQFVLDRLTDVQKNANTTRGSTPGLIDPALGEIPGNMVDLPDCAVSKRGLKRAKVNANNIPATQLGQPAPAPQNAQAPHIAQVHQAPLAPQAPTGYLDQPNLQVSRANSSNVATTPSRVISATIGALSQNISNVAAAPVLRFPTCNL